MGLHDNYHMGVIGNGRSGAVIDRNGTVCFACLPDFDSGASFCSLLDAERGGHWGVRMVGGKAVDQSYLLHTNILVTRFEGASGSFELVDFMPRYRVQGSEGMPSAPPDLIRVLRPLSGKPRVKVDFQPQLDFGLCPTETRKLAPGVIKSRSAGRVKNSQLYESLFLYTDMDERAVLSGRPTPLEGTRHMLLSYNQKLQPPDAERIRLWLAQTEAYWLGWVANTTAPPRYREAVIRSALTLKLMQFNPTGALVAALTTSLPETIGEQRNWDYRFCWIRDASMTVSVLGRLGHPDMSHRFVEWVMDTTPTKDDPLQIMYGLRGERKLTEQIIDHLSGYQGSKPVRVGNAAYKQKQHDIYGAVLDVYWQTIEDFTARLDVVEDLWTRVRSVFRTVESIWKKPDRGIWEFRGAKRHFVFSKVLCWVAADRAVKIARRLGQDGWADAHEGLAEAIHADVLKHGWSDSLGAFAQTYGSDEPDASNLLMADYGFLDPKDPRYVATVNKTWELLGRGEGLLMRYRDADDFGEPRSAFTICCFWGIKALIHIGRAGEARQRFERLLCDVNHVGLLSEDLDVRSRRQLGNFPQAYSHLALIDTALALNDVEARGWDDPDTVADQAAV